MQDDFCSFFLFNKIILEGMGKKSKKEKGKRNVTAKNFLNSSPDF
jgi:hypothetical protein